MLRVLPPWSENIGKRLHKAPKTHFRDSGLFYSLRGIRSLAELHAHPKLGASWEGFAVEQVLRALGAAPSEVYHWGTHAGAELDLLRVRGGQRWGFEVKYADAPRTTKSMRSAMESLRLERLFVIYPGALEYELDERISVLALADARRLAGRMKPDS